MSHAGPLRTPRASRSIRFCRRKEGAGTLRDLGDEGEGRGLAVAYSAAFTTGFALSLSRPAAAR